MERKNVLMNFTFYKLQSGQNGPTVALAMFAWDKVDLDCKHVRGFA